VLDERQLKVCELLAKGTTVVDIAKEVGISRQTVYDWKKLEEFVAEIDRLGQEFLNAAQGRLKFAAVLAAEEVIKLLKSGTYEKTRLSAAQDILDRNLGKATTRMEVGDSRSDKDNVTVDVLDKEIDEFESK